MIKINIDINDKKMKIYNKWLLKLKMVNIVYFQFLSYF